jgi:hypothetical protein
MSEKSEVELVKPQAPAQLMANSNGMVLGNSLEERFRVCSLYAKSGMLPKGYETPEKVFAGLQYAMELGFQNQPLTALRNIAIINGQPSLWGELPLALVMKSGLLAFKDEYFVDSKGVRLPVVCAIEDVYAAVCVVERKGFHRQEFAFTQDDRTKLGVAAIWQQFTKIMMKRKARSIALKDLFPDVMMGITIAEHDHHVYLDDAEDKNVTKLTPEQERASKVTKLYSDPASEVSPLINIDPNDSRS